MKSTAPLLKSSFSPSRITALALAGSIASLVSSWSAPSVQAATFTWDGGGVDNKAGTAVNWVGDLLPTPAGFDIIFSGTSAIGTAVDWNYAQNFRSLTFSSTALAYTIGGATPIQFITPGIDALVNSSTVTQTITDQVNVFFNGSKGFNANTGALNLTNVTFRGDSMTSGQTNTLTLTGANSGSITGIISQAGVPVGVLNALTKTGTGTWTLSGTNTYIGTTTITAGTLSVGATVNLGAAASNVVFDGGNLQITGTTLTTLSGLGHVVSFNATKTVGLDINNAANTFTADQLLNQTTGGLTKLGAGTLILNQANTYTGATTISAGTLSVGTTANLGSPTSNVVFDGGTLQITGTGLTNFSGLGHAASFNATKTVGLDINNAGNTFTADQLLNQTTGGLTKLGAGTLILNQANTYTGVTTVSAGRLINGTATTFTNKGQLTVNGTGIFDLNGNAATFTSINAGVVGATITNAGSGAILTQSGQAATVASLITGNITMNLVNANGAATPFALGNANTFNGGVNLLNSGAGTRLRIAGLITTVGAPGAITSSPFGTGAITVGQTASDKAGVLFDTVTNNTLVNDIVFNTALGTDVPGIRLDTAGHTLSGQITANLADATLSTGATALLGSASLTGKITGPAGLALTAPSNATTSTLTVTLNNAAGTNDYAGNTTITKVGSSNYTLALGTANQIPNGAGKGNVVNNGTLNLRGFNETINGLSGAGTVDGVSGAPVLTVGDNNATGNDFTGVIKNTAGSLALTKIGSGTQTLSGANTYSGGTTVSLGGLIAANPSALGINSGLNLAATTTFSYQPKVAGALALGSGVLTLNGNNVGTSVGGAVSQSAIASSASAVASGAVTVDVRGIPGVASTAGANDLITAGGGLTSGGATYTLGNIYAATDFIVTGLSVSDTAITLATVAATPLTTGFWKGGLSGASNVWAISKVGGTSNWASDAGGTPSPVVPGSGADVTFSSTGATDQGAMVLGSNLSIKSLTISDTSPVTLNDDGNILTISDAAAITVAPGAGPVNLSAKITVGVGQTWTNNNLSNSLNFGAVSNGANLLTIAGAGATTIANFNGGAGGLAVAAGTTTLTAANLTAPQTWTNNSSNPLNSGTVANGANLLTIAGSGPTTIASFLGGFGGLAVAPGTTGTTTLTSSTLMGAQTWTNNSTTSVLTAGTINNGGFLLTLGGAGDSSITGAMGGMGGFTKVGTGITTLLGTSSYAGPTLLTAGILVVGSTDALGSIAVGTTQSGASELRLPGGVITAAEPLSITGGGITNLGALRNFSGDNTYSGPITMAAQSRINSDSGTLTLNAPTSVSSTNLALIIGGAGNITISGIVALGTGFVSRDGAGTLTLSGANTYTGTTTVAAGVIKNGSATTFTNKGTLSLSGTGIFDLGGFDARFTNVAASTTTNTITNTGGADATLNISAIATQISALITDGPTNKLAISLANANSAINLFKVDSPNTFSGGITLLNNAAAGTRLRISSLITNVGSAGAIISSPYGTGAITIGQVATDKAGILFDTVASNTLLNALVFNTALGTDVAGIRLDTAGHTLSGKITANTVDATFSGGAGAPASATLTGQVTGTGGLNVAATIAGVGNLKVTLANAGPANNYAGNTTISTVKDFLLLGAADQIPNGLGSGNVVNNGTLDLGGFSETINGLNGSGTVEGGSGTPTLTVGDGNAAGSFSGVIKNTAGSLAFTKMGSGKETLGGANTYTGDTNVNQGHLQVTGTLTGTIVNVNANASANFEASQTLPALNIGNGAVVTLGALPPAALEPDFALAAQAVPEPGAATLVLSGLSALLGLRRRRRA